MDDRKPPLEPFHELSEFAIDPGSVRLLPYAYASQHDVVVLGVVDASGREPVVVGMTDPGDLALVDEIARVLERPVRPVKLNAYEVQKALAIGHGLGDPDADRFTLALRPVRQLSFARDEPVTEILNQILGRAVLMRASDVHIESYDADVDVRLRIDGILHQLPSPVSRDNVAAVVSRLKVLSDLDIAEHRIAQDGRVRAAYEADGESRLIDFRVSIVPGPFGEDAVLRVLDSDVALLDLAELGMHADVVPVFERLIANPEGLILVSGPTGSGKTTTLYSALDRVRAPERKVLSVEDPIEYHFPKTSQKQVTPQMGFAAFARAFMRQNPDVILIGEIRDEETASAAIRAAQTGHLVFSTLHATDAVRTVSRMATLGVDPNLLASTLVGALSQRLMRRICEACRRPAAPTAAEARRFGLDPDDRSFFSGEGCAACRGTGYRGRTGAYELFAPDDELSDLVASATAPGKLRRKAVAKGMRTLVDDALGKARAGITSLFEIQRVIPYRILERRSGG